MKLEFTKMQGCGNDYIYINCLEREIPSPESLSIFLSNRHYAIGGDGVVFILPSGVADVRMRMFNLDGSEGLMCGNAIRCVAKYVYDRAIVKKLHMKIETLSGVKALVLSTVHSLVSSVKVDMGRVTAEKTMLYGTPVTYVNVGNPHCVRFYDDISTIDVATENYDQDASFPQGINTEFVKVVDKNTLKMRVWERGSGETLGCGTGACAAVVAAVLNGYCRLGEDIKVLLLGGELMINYSGENVVMTGDCETVFEGIIEL